MLVFRIFREGFLDQQVTPWGDGELTEFSTASHAWPGMAFSDLVQSSYMSKITWSTPLEFNIEPENHPLDFHEIPFKNPSFSGETMLNFGGVLNR